MSGPPPATTPPDGRVNPKNSPRLAGRILGALCWLALLGSAVVLAVAWYIRLELSAEGDRLRASVDGQREIAVRVASLASDTASGSVPSVSAVSTLRHASLETLARTPFEPSGGLQAQWSHLAAGLDAIEADAERLDELRVELEVLRVLGQDLLEGSTRLADALGKGPDGDPRRNSGEVLATVSRQFADEIERTDFIDLASRLARARKLLDVYAHSRDLVSDEIIRRPAIPSAAPADLRAELTALEAQVNACGRGLDAARRTAGELAHVLAEIAALEEAGKRLLGLLSAFDDRSAPSPVILGIALETWQSRSALVALIGLLGVAWGRRRRLKSETERLDRAWAEAAESDWRARGLVRELIHAIRALSPDPARPGGIDHLETSARKAIASLPGLVEQRAQRAALLLSAREPLRNSLDVARESALAHLTAGDGDLDPAAFLAMEATFREAARFEIAALVREIRETASPAATPTDDLDPATVGRTDRAAALRVVARGFEVLDQCLERALAGEANDPASVLFVLDDLRAVRHRASYSGSLDSAPDPGHPGGPAGPGIDAELASGARHLLPSFRRALGEWSDSDAGDRREALERMKGGVQELARAARAGAADGRGFWDAASAFLTALREGLIPAGPAVERILDEMAQELDATVERGAASPPSARLFRQLLLYLAVVESDQADIPAVQEAFGLHSYRLSIPEPPDPASRPEDRSATGISGELIGQLEDIRAVLDRDDDRPAADRRG